MPKTFTGTMKNADGSRSRIEADDVTIRLHVGGQMVGYLERLRRLGLWGETVEEVIWQLVRTGLQEVIAKEFIGTITKDR